MNSGELTEEEIAVVYNAADLRALYGACRKCRRGLTWVLIIPALFGLVSYLDGFRGMALIYEMLPYALIAVAIIAAFYFIVPLWQMRARRRNGWGKPMFVSMAAEGLRTRHPSQDSLFHWSAIRDVVAKGGRLFLFTTPACAIILPRRVFASDRQFAEWTTNAEAFWKDTNAAEEAAMPTT